MNDFLKLAWVKQASLVILALLVLAVIGPLALVVDAIWGTINTSKGIFNRLVTYLKQLHSSYKFFMGAAKDGFQ